MSDHERELEKLYGQDPVYHQFRNMTTELGTFLLEREDAIHLALAALLIKHNVLFISAPGEVKTTLLNLIAKAIEGASFFAVELYKLTSPEFVFGPPDMQLYEREGVFRHRINGMAPWAHIVFLDEVFSGNPAVVQGTASLSNPDQRTFSNADVMEACPTFTVYAAANRLPDFEEDIELAKIYDRYLFRLVIQPVGEKENFLRLLDVEIPKELTSKVTLMEFRGLQRNVQWVEIPHHLKELRWDLKKGLDKAGIEVSSRRWRWTTDAIRASAFLDKRVAAIDEDLLILKHVLWTDPKDYKTVENLIIMICFPKYFAALEHLKRAQELLRLAQEGKSLQERLVEIKKIYEQVSALLPGARTDYEKRQIRSRVLPCIEQIEKVVIQTIVASGGSKAEEGG